MSKQNNSEPVYEPSELENKVKQADPMIQDAISEYKKEIARLRKLLVKEQIAHESEKAHLLERIEQEKNTAQIVMFNDLDKES